MSLNSILTIIAGVGILGLILVIVWLVFYIIGMFKLFEKGGEAGWKAIVPFYNNYILTKITGLSCYWFLILLLPTIFSILGIGGVIYNLGLIASLVSNVCIYYNLSKIFNKSIGWIVLSVFFGWITLPLLGISKKNTWNSVELNKNAMFVKKG